MIPPIYQIVYRYRKDHSVDKLECCHQIVAHLRHSICEKYFNQVVLKIVGDIRDLLEDISFLRKFKIVIVECLFVLLIGYAVKKELVDCCPTARAVDRLLSHPHDSLLRIQILNDAVSAVKVAALGSHQINFAILKFAHANRAFFDFILTFDLSGIYFGIYWLPLSTEESEEHILNGGPELRVDYPNESYHDQNVRSTDL